MNAGKIDMDGGCREILGWREGGSYLLISIKCLLLQGLELDTYK